MSTITELREALATLTENSNAGFNSVADALTELSTDVEGLNTRIAELTERVDNPEIQAEITSIRETGESLAERTAAIAQAIRDAVPTDPAVEEDEGEPGDEASGGSDDGE